MNRRKFILAAAVGGSTVSLAGCLGIGDDDGDDTSDDDENGGEQEPPSAAFEWDPDSPPAGVEITFDASNSEAPDSELVEYRWEFHGETVTTDSPSVAHAFEESGEKTVELDVENEEGQTDNIGDIISVEPPESLEEGISLIEQIAVRLDELTTVEVDRTEDDVEELLGWLADAQGALDEAEQVATGVDAEKLEDGRTVLAFQEMLIEHHEMTLEAIDAFQRLAPEESNSGNIEEVSPEEGLEAMDAATVTLNDTLTLWDTIESEQANLNHNLGDSIPSYPMALETYLRYGQTELVEFRGLVEFFQGLYAASLDIAEALDTFNQEQWDESETAFLDAAETFQESVDSILGINPTELERIGTELPDRIVGDLSEFGAFQEEIESFIQIRIDGSQEATDAVATARDGDIQAGREMIESLFPRESSPYPGDW